MSSNCGPFASNCQPGQGAELQTSRSLPQYALLGFLFLFVMAVFIVIFLIRTRNLCLDARRQRSFRLGSSRTAGGVPVSPAEPLIRPGQGLDSGFVQALPLFSYKKGGIPDSAGLKGVGDCSVCLSEYQEGEGVRLLPGCKHLFHPDCVDTWLLSHTSCPLCRANVQVKKQSSLRRVLSLLSGRYQAEDFADAGDGTTATPGGHAVVLMITPDVPPAAPIPGQVVPPATTPHPSQAGGGISQTGAAAAAPTENDVMVPMAREGRSYSSEVEQADAQSSCMLGGNGRNRRPGTEDICWAAADASVLDTTTPRPVKRAASLGRDHVSLRQRPFFERRHSFTEMLRKSIRKEPSLTRSLSRPSSMDPDSTSAIREQQVAEPGLRLPPL